MKRIGTTMAALTLALTVAVPIAAPSAEALGAGRPKLFAPTYMSKSGLYSRADAVKIASHYDFVAANSKQLTADTIAAMRVANPAVKIVVYLNGTFDLETVRSYPAGEYARDATGSFIRSVKYDNWLMDPSQPTWGARVSQLCTTLMAPGYDGCFVDMLGQSLLNKSYLTGKPINPATGVEWTVPQWQRAAAMIGQKVQEDHPGSLIIGNGLSHGQNYFAPSGPSSLLFTGLDYALAEVWLRQAQFSPTKYKAPTQWKQDVDILTDAGSQGKHASVTVKVWTTATAAQRESLHRYALASFLLGTNGGSYFSFTNGQTGTEFQANAGDPLDNIAVGTPMEAYRGLANGAYRRAYSNALVVVNPTTSTVTVPTPSCVTLDGRTVTSLTMTANTGEICRTA
ncbi:MAG TPA: putative glycoside hydrolase [Dermatophilaceae bacterium]|nr:putative glycoside hydrolase [Dermatophilaceae bacterium]